MKIAVFGGTFDPVHLAHTGIGHAILSAGYAEKVLYLPAPVPPHKAEKRITAYEHRRAMLELVMEPGMEICDLERERTGKSYTFDTLGILTERYPGDAFSWVIGSDSLRQLHTWHRAEELVQNYSFLTYPRDRESIPDAAELNRHWRVELTEKLLSGIMTHAVRFPESSTDVRERLRSGDYAAASKLLALPVLNYIREHKLYTENEND